MSGTATSPEGFEYRVDSTGTIHQVDPTPIRYTPQYILERYVPPAIQPETLAAMAHLRWGFFLGLTQDRPRPARVLDWGYGAGAFLKAVGNTPGVRAHGFDVSGWPIPDGCEFVAHPLSHQWDLVTFYDVLEHIEDLTFLHDLRAAQLVVTVPWCHAVGQDHVVDWPWLWRWKHFRPNEHLHHWDALSLTATLYRYGFKVLGVSGLEDIVRREPAGTQNILTVYARRI